MKTSHLPARGFTLVELLVTATIIGILASIITVGLSSSRANARDARRIADLQTIRYAMDMYAVDHGQYYAVDGASNCSQTVGKWNALQAALSPYVHTLPTDPTQTCDSSGNLIQGYVATSTATAYKFAAILPENPTNTNQKYWDPARDGGTDSTKVDGPTDGSGVTAYALYTSGGVSF